MGLPKGKTNNPKGRPQGPNKITAELRQRIKLFLEGQFETIECDFKTLAPDRRVVLFERYLKFVLPQLQSSSVDLNIDRMSDEELAQIINRLKNKNVNDKED
jgi:hypothetical protein